MTSRERRGIQRTWLEYKSATRCLPTGESPATHLAVRGGDARADVLCVTTWAHLGHVSSWTSGVLGLSACLTGAHTRSVRRSPESWGPSVTSEHVVALEARPVGQPGAQARRCTNSAKGCAKCPTLPPRHKRPVPGDRSSPVSATRVHSQISARYLMRSIRCGGAVCQRVSEAQSLECIPAKLAI